MGCFQQSFFVRFVFFDAEQHRCFRYDGCNSQPHDQDERIGMRNGGDI